MTKKNVLILSLIGVIVFVVSMYSVDFGVCKDVSYDCRKTVDSVQTIFSVFLLLFFLSLITYKMRDEIFQAWWGVARWFVPVIIIVTFFLNTSHQQGGFGGVAQGAFYFAILFILYAIFIITSLVRIVIAWREIKTGQRISPIKSALLVVFIPILLFALLWYIASFL